MSEYTATVRNEAGIHCRPSAVIIHEVASFNGAITIDAGSGSCDLRSIMGLLSLGLQKGAQITIRIEGEEGAIYGPQLVELFEREFDFPPREDA